MFNSFWRKKTFISYLLLPFSFLYLFAIFINRIRYSKTQANKNSLTICIGNLTVGGAGKTPIAIEIGMILKKLSMNFCYLSRGYKGKIKDLTEVKIKQHNSVESGDEPILLSEIGKTFVSKRSRSKDIRNLNKKYDVIVTDDGLQDLEFNKDLSILVIDGEYGFGNNLLLPSGPLREPVKFIYDKINIVIIIGKDEHLVEKLFHRKKIIHAYVVATNLNLFENKKVICFSGIARPTKFFSLLKTAKGIKITKQIEYPDHYQYDEKEIKNLIELAGKTKSILATTKKDWVRIPSKYQKRIKYLNIRIKFNNKRDIEETIISSFKRKDPINQ